MSIRRGTTNKLPQLPHSQYVLSNPGVLEDGMGAAVHYGNTAVQPGLNELLQGSRKSIK